MSKRLATIITALAINLSFGHPVANAETTPRLADVIIQNPNLPAVTEGSLWAGLVYLDVDNIRYVDGTTVSAKADEYMVVISLGMTQQRQHNGRYSAANQVQKFFITGNPAVDQALVEEAASLACAEHGQCTLRLVLATPEGFMVEGEEPTNI